MKCSAILSFCILASAASAAPSFSSQYELDGASSLRNHRGGNNIVDRLREDKRFSKFVEVLEKERGLKDELDSGKRTTVFAPTNEAFEKHEKEWAAADERDRPSMKEILRYHIAPDAELTSDCLHSGALIPTALRLRSLGDRHQRIRVHRFADTPFLNLGARVHENEVEADNGLIYAITQVLMPPATVGETIMGFPTVFSTFATAVHRTQMRKDICNKKEITAFVPENDAWKALGLENLQYLFSCHGQEVEQDRHRLSDSDRSSEGQWCQGTKDLQKIVEAHIATKLAYTTDFMDKKTTTLKTLGDSELQICSRKKAEQGKRDDKQHNNVNDYYFNVNDGEARVMYTDGLGSNGAIQVIDQVIIPKGVRLPHDARMMM